MLQLAFGGVLHGGKDRNLSEILILKDILATGMRLEGTKMYGMKMAFLAWQPLTQRLTGSFFGTISRSETEVSSQVKPISGTRLGTILFTLGQDVMIQETAMSSFGGILKVTIRCLTQITQLTLWSTVATIGSSSTLNKPGFSLEQRLWQLNKKTISRQPWKTRLALSIM